MASEKFHNKIKVRSYFVISKVFIKVQFPDHVHLLYFEIKLKFIGFLPFAEIDIEIFRGFYGCRKFLIE